MTRTRGEVPGLASGQRAKVPRVEQHWRVKRAPGQARPQRQAAGFWAAGPVPSERALPPRVSLSPGPRSGPRPGIQGKDLTSHKS